MKKLKKKIAAMAMASTMILSFAMPVCAADLTGQNTEATDTEVKNRCHLYLNLATPKKVAFPGNSNDFIVTNDAFVNENAVLVEKGRGEAINMVLCILKNKINLLEEYKKELSSIKYYHDRAAEKKYKTLGEWKEKLDIIERKILIAENEVPMYQNMYDLIKQDQSVLRMYIEVEHARWNQAEKHIKAFPYMKYGNIWIGFAVKNRYDWTVITYREEPVFKDVPETLFYEVHI